MKGGLTEGNVCLSSQKDNAAHRSYTGTVWCLVTVCPFVSATKKYHVKDRRVEESPRGLCSDNFQGVPTGTTPVTWSLRVEPQTWRETEDERIEEVQER